VLKPRTRPGKPLVDVLDLKDVTIELEVTPNRADALSHLGLARELAAIYRLPLPKLSIRVRESGVAAANLTRVEIKDKRCVRYAARVLSGLKVGPSPQWLQRRLRSVGFMPVCNVIDAANLVMVEIGQPLQSFDLDRLAPERIMVRAARAQESLDLPDGAHVLTPEDLVVAADQKPIALAGVAIDSNVAVRAQTVRVLLTAGVFEPTAIYKAARKHQNQTESTLRLEHGVDPEAVERALDRCAQLILELADGVVHKGGLVAEKAILAPKSLSIRPQRATQVLGRPVEKKEIREALVALGLRPIRRPSKRPTKKTSSRKAAAAAEALFFQVPSWRADLESEDDLIAEVVRLAGLDELPAALPSGPSRPWTSGVPFAPEDAARDVLVGEGFLEAISSAFHDERVVEVFGYDGRAPVRLDNPLDEDRAFMRLSVLPALLEAARLNQGAVPSMTDLRLFEVGRTFRWSYPQP
ncbi:MAG: phenylalanine--tRNA ligase subunit beta, partial [Myxococcota bacterium]